MRHIPHPGDNPDAFDDAVRQTMRDECLSRDEAEHIVIERAFRDRDDESENRYDD